MSRKGKLPISIPKGVEVTVNQKEIIAKGPKGTLKQDLIDGITVSKEGNFLTVALDKNSQCNSRLFGLYRGLINNVVCGSGQGFTKTLDMIGVGYRAAVQGKLLDLQVGFSHPTNLPIPEGITVTIEKNTKIILTGSDKQQVGQFAAEIRALRPPEPYNGKGIRYTNEYVRKKAGKSTSKK